VLERRRRDREKVLKINERMAAMAKG